MKISVDYTKQDELVLKIVSAKYLADYVIRIQFNDGTEKIIDFKPFLKNAVHPSIKKYLDESVFAKFDIVDGNLNWNDYDLIFPIWDLYNNNILKDLD
ncbi:MAG: DUF2442 domain-containing protein [Chitinophagales bacterium]